MRNVVRLLGSRMAILAKGTVLPRQRWDVTTVDKSPGLRTKDQILSRFPSREENGDREMRWQSFHGHLARPRVVLQPALQVGFFLAGLPRGSPTDGLQRLSSLRKTGHVPVLVWFV